MDSKYFKVRIQVAPGEFFERTTYNDQGSPEQAAVDTVTRIAELGIKSGYTPQVESVEPARF